jgi:antitoxin (DNA-binding transcriptional repressor) of toxin-antitoxin stability system
MTEPASESTTVRLSEARMHLSELGERAAEGEEIIVTKRGAPLFKIAALRTPQS